MGNIIAVIGEKGGTGKSTLAQNLAIYWQKMPGFPEGKVLLMDTDIPQYTSSQWGEIRNLNPNLQPLDIIEKSGDVSHILKSLKNKYEVIIVDCGGHDNHAARGTLLVAHLALLPTRPKRRDLKSFINMSSVVKEAKIYNKELEARAVLMQCRSLPSNPTRIELTKEVCRKAGIKPLDPVIYERHSYDDCEENGLSILEYWDIKAKEEFAAVAREALKVLKIVY